MKPVQDIKGPAGNNANMRPLIAGEAFLVNAGRFNNRTKIKKGKVELTEYLVMETSESTYAPSTFQPANGHTENLHPRHKRAEKKT